MCYLFCTDEDDDEEDDEDEDEEEDDEEDDDDDEEEEEPPQKAVRLIVACECVVFHCCEEGTFVWSCAFSVSPTTKVPHALFISC